ncbi:MAG: hypothetical protein N4A33_03230 [Bacteriovoracaceae bacterium]|jgi:predicted negative regulator of RcsB-dependent stress response|nr:hypothetical protein [Bacteriovoracaceae bacterium]
MSEQNTEQTLDETLNRTDFGQLINDNKKPILIVAAILVVGIIAFSFINNQRVMANQESLNRAFEFKVSVMDAYKEKKIKADDFITKMNSMAKEIEGSVSLVPSLLQNIDQLVKENKAEQAAAILKNWSAHFRASNYNLFFINIKRASLLEDLGKKDETISLLEQMKKSSIKVLKSKILLDLARLQMSSNPKAAKENLNIIIKDFESSSEASMAKVYLSRL